MADDLVWYNQLINQATVKLPGVSQAGLNAALFDVYREFFNDSSAWVEHICFDVQAAPQNSPPAIPYAALNYELVPEFGQIIRLWGVCDTTYFLPYPAVLTRVGENAAVRIGYPPNVAQSLKATVSLTVTPPQYPTNPPTGGPPLVPAVFNPVVVPTASGPPYPVQVPASILQVWGLVIVDGLVGNMMNQKAKSYTDPTGAVYHLKRFRDGITRARIATLRANTFGTQSWTFPQGFRTNSQNGYLSVGNDARFRS